MIRKIYNLKYCQNDFFRNAIQVPQPHRGDGLKTVITKSKSLHYDEGPRVGKIYFGGVTL